MLPQGANRTRWLIGIAAGLAVGLLDLAVWDSDWPVPVIFLIAPALFAGALVLLLRRVERVHWWAGLIFVAGVVAAHRGGFELALRSYIDLDNSIAVSALVYGATIGATAAGLGALMSRQARHVGAFAGTVIAASMAALAYEPLTNGLSLDAAMPIAFGLVDCAVAAVLGLRLFAGAPAAPDGAAGAGRAVSPG